MQANIMLLQNNIAHILQQNHIMAEVEHIGTDTIQVKINGDWKHDHLTADNLVRDYLRSRGEYFTANKIEHENSDESDCYTAIHEYCRT